MIGSKERYNQKIYAIGGRDFHKRASRVVEVLDCDHLDAGWMVLGSPLTEARGSPACAAVYETPCEEDTNGGTYLCVCGIGENGKRLNTGESYDPKQRVVSDGFMKEARSAAMTFALGDEMYVVGGENGDAYDADDGVLRTMEITTPKLIHGAVVLPCPWQFALQLVVLSEILFILQVVGGQDSRCSQLCLPSMHSTTSGLHAHPFRSL